MSLSYLRLACAFGLVLLAKSAAGQEADGAGVFEQTCAGCHGARSSMERAPKLDALRLQQPRFVVDTLTSGVMRAQAQRLNPSEIRAVAEYVTGKALSVENAEFGKGPLYQSNADARQRPRRSLAKLGQGPIQHALSIG